MQRKKPELTEAQKIYDKKLNVIKRRWDELISETEVIEKLRIDKRKLKKLRDEKIIEKFTIIIPSKSGKGQDIIYSMSELTRVFHPKGTVKLTAARDWDDVVSENEVIEKTGLTKKQLRDMEKKKYLLRVAGWGRNRFYSKTEMGELLLLMYYMNREDFEPWSNAVSALLKIIHPPRRY